MVTIYLGIRQTMPNADGTFGIKVVVNSNGKTAYISTRFKIDNIKQWKDGKVVKRPDAEAMNAKLRKLLNEYESILETIPNPYADATEIRKYLEAKRSKSDLLKDFVMSYIERLKKEGRTSYAQNMGYTLKYLIGCFGENMTLQQFNSSSLSIFEDYLRGHGSSDTTINIRMTHLKALLNAAVNSGMVEYKIFPFRNYKIPQKSIREIWLSKAELSKLREADFKGVSEHRFTVARDLFMLSFYCAGINLTDLVDARLDGDTINFVRKKTATKKHGEKNVSLTIQPEARTIIDKYITADGRLDFGYNYRDYEQFRSFVTKGLNKIGENLGFTNKLMYYSARKTFVQFGQQLGIPIHVLEYSIGQSIKDASQRPIFDYLRVMRFQSDLAVRAVIDYSLDPSTDEMPIPEWAKKHVSKN